MQEKALFGKPFVDSKGFTVLLASEAAKQFSYASISAARGPADASDCVKTQKSSKTGDGQSFGEAEKRVTGQI